MQLNKKNNASPSNKAKTRIRPNYGVERSATIRGLMAFGAVACLTGLFLPAFSAYGFKLYFPSYTLLAIGLMSLGQATALLLFGMRGKYNLAALILKEANCRGHEAVLDIGTGTGLLAASAAKKLSSGTVTSLTGGDLSPPEMALVLRNFMAEEVDARVQILEGDCRASRFEDAAFDVAVSLMGLSDCVASEEDLVDTCHEIIRMLRPRGLVVVAASASDTKAISMALMKAGARVLPPQNCWLHAYIPAYIVKARKPA